MQSSLLVVDLDTVLAERVAERDRAALERARRSGCEIAFTSSARAPAARERARALGLEGWIVGCDGAQLARARDGHILCRHTLPASVATRALEIVSSLGLTALTLGADAAHGPAGAEDLARAALGVAAEGYSTKAPLRTEICALVAVGDTPRVHEADAALADLAPTRIRRVTYALPSGGAAMRASSRRGSRARAIADLAARLGTRRTRVALVTGVTGPYVDASALGEVGRVFCIEGVPAELIGPRCERLETSGEGAIAEAVERWMSMTTELVSATA